MKLVQGKALWSQGYLIEEKVKNCHVPFAFINVQELFCLEFAVVNMVHKITSARTTAK